MNSFGFAMKETSLVVENYPVFSMNQALEKRTVEVLKLHKKGKSKKRDFIG
ncbi:MAG: hypothetical protein KKF80_08295 [Candidatus Omnitrophica bacterium]|nr:hypothetical protein [Candidatus Omnitrophota bacterium]